MTRRPDSQPTCKPPGPAALPCPSATPNPTPIASSLTTPHTRSTPRASQAGPGTRPKSQPPLPPRHKTRPQAHAPAPHRTSSQPFSAGSQSSLLSSIMIIPWAVLTWKTLLPCWWGWYCAYVCVVCVGVCARVHVCACACACVRVRAHACVGAFMHTSAHLCTGLLHACVSVQVLMPCRGLSKQCECELCRPASCCCHTGRRS